jgi:iron-sulfur cluster repair protein YtfE (RIC family)
VIGGEDVPAVEPDLDLARRTGLPEALRALVAAYPREAWEAHPHFAGLVRFWLERHLMFRRLDAALAAETQAAISGDVDPRAFAATLARLGSAFTGELVAHHHVEDMHYFPLLERREGRLARGFAMLDRDHHALDAHLAAYAEAANAVLRKTGAPDLPDRIGAFEEQARRLGSLLDRHLIDEEDLVVPVILKHGPGGLA